MMKTLVHIDGVQGSGKTYICSQLKKAECYDTDDIMYKAFAHIENKKLPHTDKTLFKIEKQIVKDIVQKSKVSVIVFVGMTVTIDKPTHKFFIKIPKSELGPVYKRLLSRELDKIYTNYHKMKKTISSEKKPEFLAGKLKEVAKLGVDFPVSFTDFSEDYQERVKEATKKKYVLKTQSQIIAFINNLKV